MHIVNGYCDPSLLPLWSKQGSLHWATWSCWIYQSYFGSPAYSDRKCHYPRSAFYPCPPQSSANPESIYVLSFFLSSAPTLVTNHYVGNWGTVANSLYPFPKLCWKRFLNLLSPFLVWQEVNKSCTDGAIWQVKCIFSNRNQVESLRLNVETSSNFINSFRFFAKVKVGEYFILISLSLSSVIWVVD